DSRAAKIPGARLIDCDAIESRQIKSTRQVAAERADIFVELAPAGETFYVPDPTLIGEGNSRTLHATTRSSFLTCLRDSRIRSRSAFACVDDVALLEYQGTELTRANDHLDFDPWIFHSSHETAWVMMPEAHPGSLKFESAFSLMGPHSHDFGHWLWDYLPKYIAAKLSGVLPPCPILIDAAMPRIHRQALQCMCP